MADTAWFREARLGLFIHWGPVSIRGTEITCSRGGYDGPDATVPAEEYDTLYRAFNPTRFDAREWVDIARDMGAGYIVFTTKHGDGFCMFDSALTDYKITSAPFGKDVLAMLADAVHASGLRLGLYYAPPDWHHPDFRSAQHPRYVAYLHGQLRELCSGYGRVDILWFDSRREWNELWDTPALFGIVRELQPWALINDRAGPPGDFDTPEQEMGRFQDSRPWESCITLGEQWSYKPNDRLKTARECIRTLVRCACGDGNLLLNVGPTSSGEIEPEQVCRLREMGAWLRKYGTAIYGTRGGPFIMGSRGGSTFRGTTVYLHILDWPEDPLHLPPIDAAIRSYRSISGGTPVVKQGRNGIEVSLAEAERDPVDTIVALELDTPASGLPPQRCYQPLTLNRTVSASSTAPDLPDYCCGPCLAVDDDLLTWWEARGGDLPVWLEVDLGAPEEFGRAFISEHDSRVREFELEARDGDGWRVLAHGTTIGQGLWLAFPLVTARVVRLRILSSTGAPSIAELQLFAEERWKTTP